jgi:hypothetical protein
MTMQILNNSTNQYEPIKVVERESRKDVYLDKLLAVLNEGRAEMKLKLITYARLQMMLKKVGKSKKNWDRDIFIGNVLDSKNPAKYFWWKIKQND